MLTLKFVERENWRTMIRIEKKLGDQLERGVEATAKMIVKDIRSNWFGIYPPASSDGSPPAIRSGVLDRSVKDDKQGRDVLGRFATNRDAKVWFVRIDTAEEDPRGHNYSMALEDPDYLNRPFLVPALERSGEMFSTNLKRFIRL